jgi:hypothetical protein
MSEFVSENNEMSVGVFTAETLKTHIAPRNSGANVKDRIRVAARKLGWSYTRTKDAWYGDPRISISGEELRDIEEISGVTYARAEIRTNDQLIANAEVLLMGTDPDFHSAFTAGLRSFIGAFYRPRNRGN